MASALASELSCRGKTHPSRFVEFKEESPFYKLNPSVSFSPLGTNKGWFGKIRKTLSYGDTCGTINSHFNWVCDVRR